VASSSGFGDPLDNVFKEALDKLFGEFANSEFGASGSGFGVPLETDSCMDDLFFNNEMPDDQLLFATDIILDSNLESNLNQYGITGSKAKKFELDQNYNESNAELNELDPDANLFLYLNDHSDQACINLAAHTEKTEVEEQTTTQHISPSSFISLVGINDQIGYVDLNQIDYMDQSILFTQEVEYVETETDQMNNIRGPDNRHRKGPKQLSKEDIKDDSKWKNVKRCRVYRKNKTKKITVEKTELQILEDQNNELKAREAKLKEKVSKMKNLYLKLISEGRIRFG